MAKLSKKTSEILKKYFIHLSLNKKKSIEMQASLENYIKAVSFTLYQE